MKLADPEFIPVHTVQLAKDWWIARTPDHEKAWFAPSSLEAVVKAQVQLGFRAALKVMP